MRLITRHRQHHRSRAPRISISQAEITADLIYPARAHARHHLTTSARKVGR